MKTKEQIEHAIERLQANKSKTAMYSNFGDNNHNALDIMIRTLRNNWDGL